MQPHPPKKTLTERTAEKLLFDGYSKCLIQNQKKEPIYAPQLNSTTERTSDKLVLNALGDHTSDGLRTGG